MQVQMSPIHRLVLGHRYLERIGYWTNTAPQSPLTWVRYACRPTQLQRGRTPAVRPAHYLHVRTQLRSLRINIHVCYLTLVPLLHQSSTSTNASAKSNILPHQLLPSFHFHQLDIRKILHVQFHLPSIYGHDAMSLGSAIYYWCGQKTPQPTW